MKRFIIILPIICVILLVFSSCQNSSKTYSGVDVIIEGGGQFPEFLVGGWKSDKYNWEFVFEPDGTISSAMIDTGLVRVNPNEKFATIQLRDEGKADYQLGRWTVQYSPDERELMVEVVIKHFYIDKISFVLEGKSRDWFLGNVSDDLQTWRADWYTFPEYIAMGQEQKLEFPFDPNNNPISTLIFTKQAETK